MLRKNALMKHPRAVIIPLMPCIDINIENQHPIYVTRESTNHNIHETLKSPIGT